MWIFVLVIKATEHGVALIEHYKCFIRNEEQLQYLLPVLSEYRTKFQIVRLWCDKINNLKISLKNFILENE